MPRSARAAVGGVCYHVLNRGNRRAQVFHHEGDYHAFVKLLRQACVRVPMRVLGYCLLPNHFHLVLWPTGDRDLSRWLDWLLTTHVRRYHACHATSGHLWQGRCKAFPIQQDDHLLTVLRYVERNALRAKLVARAEDWLPSRLDLIASVRQSCTEQYARGSVVIDNQDGFLHLIGKLPTRAEPSSVLGRFCHLPDSLSIRHPSEHLDSHVDVQTDVRMSS